MESTVQPPQIIYEDNHLVVVDKPPLLATMGVDADEPSLVKWTKQWLKEKYQKPGNVYLGVVSRLDAFTSGILVLAKTSKAAARLTKQFQTRVPKKTYTAILESRPAQAKGRLTDWLIKDDALRRMVTCEPDHPGARKAELTYKTLGLDRDRALVQVCLLTGRKHQIRVQFASRGMPILGDRKYAGEQSFPRGIALHSTSLVFQHPVRPEEMSFRVEPPKYWKLARFGDK